jgi:serine/threonine protein kinase
MNGSDPREKSDGSDYRPRREEHSATLDALGRGGKDWRTKLFVIRDNFLMYFRDGASIKPEGVIPLEGSAVSISGEYERCVEVSTGERRYHLRTATDAERDVWAHKLSEAAAMTVESIYEMRETIGSGSFATVKRAVERSSGREFAVKIIHKHALEENRESIMNEILVLKNVSQPNIMRFHHVFETKRRIYLVTQLLRGGELFDLIVRRGSLSEAESSRIMRRVTQAVMYLHLKKICHRDLKPENLMFAQKDDLDSICVTDFGLSRIGGTMKTACGTPSYVAPEVLSGETYGPECDVWSCGVILYVLLCGFPPFWADNDSDLYDLIRRGEFSFPSPYWDAVSDSAKELVRGMLVVDPAKRMTSEDILGHPFISARRPLSRQSGMSREISLHLITQKNQKKRVTIDDK